MAANVVVIDTAFRRATVKVTPQTHLSDVLEQACQKLGLRSENYALKCVLKACSAHALGC
jgi:tether containing UBX domain for GLUT4